MPSITPLRPMHPSMEGYVGFEGPNLVTAWPALAACLDEPLEIFMPADTHPKWGRPDIPICADCPVRDSCLLDVLAKTEDIQIGRRAGLANKAIRVLGKNLRNLLDDGTRDLADNQTTYLGVTKKEFYTSHPLALPLVHEWLDWNEAVAQYKAAEEPEGPPPIWPTEQAIQLSHPAP